MKKNHAHLDQTELYIIIEQWSLSFEYIEDKWTREKKLKCKIYRPIEVIFGVEFDDWYWMINIQYVYNRVLFSTADWIFRMNSSTAIVPGSPPNRDRRVTVLFSTSFGPTTAISGTFCFSAFLMSFGNRSP